jgi:phosphoribosylanthranilate isomerase
MGTRVKICGVTELADARLAAELGAWAIGMVLWPHSPRACSPEAAEEIGVLLRRQVQTAGVFVNQTLEEITWAADRYGLALLQLHGDEGPAYCREAARRTGCRVIKAVRVRDAASVRAIAAFRTDFHLLDGHVPGRRGGTGEPFDWELVRRHDKAIPLLLSGGLDAENLATAIATVHPYAVDVASGVEAAPGRKDEARMRAFFEAATAADAALAPTQGPGRERGVPAPEPAREALAPEGPRAPAPGPAR